MDTEVSLQSVNGVSEAPDSPVAFWGWSKVDRKFSEKPELAVSVLCYPGKCRYLQTHSAFSSSKHCSVCVLVASYGHIFNRSSNHNLQPTLTTHHATYFGERA